jgi:hypothetical protein
MEVLCFSGSVSGALLNDFVNQAVLFGFLR